MSTLEKDGLMDCLFSRQDKKLVNIKFMRGEAKVISPGEFREAICSMVDQRSGDPCGPAKSGREQVDVRHFVANL